MEYNNIIWLIALVILLIAVNILFNSVIMYIRNKPLGHETIYDVVFTDNLRLIQISISTGICIEILSRFENLRSFPIYNNYIVFVCCLLVFNAFLSFNVFSSLVCIVRIICLIKMDFIENSVGEKIVRIIISGITISLCTGSSIIVIEKGEMNSGPFHSLLSGENLQSGNYFFTNYFVCLTVHSLKSNN